MKRLELAVVSPDGERVDVFAYLPGDVIALTQKPDRGRQHTPGLVAISDVVGVRLADPEAEAAARAS
jgi:hypothetical protein